MDRYGRAATAALLTVLAACGTQAPSQGRDPADACYHLACDDVDNVDVERVALFAQATFAVTSALAADR